MDSERRPPIIFLDIDGVLITDESVDWKTADPRCVRWLNQLIEDTRARIVVSSVWRFRGDVDWLQALLCDWGVLSGVVIGKTPRLVGEERGREIQNWLLDNKYTGGGFVIIDDDADMHPYMSFLVQTKSRSGMTRETYRQAKRLLRLGGRRVNAQQAL